MKNLIFPLLFLFSGFVFARAQTYETIGILQPLEPLKMKKVKPKNLAVESLPITSIDFDLKIETVNLPNTSTGFALILNVPNREIVFEDNNVLSEAYLNIFGRVVAENKKDSIFEEKLLIRLDKSTLEETMKKSVTYRKIFELAPGKYRIDIIVRDTKSGNRGIRSERFEILD